MVDAWAALGIRGGWLLARQSQQRETAASAVEGVGRLVKRLGVRFQVGELDESEYRSEYERLSRQRAIYAAAAAEEPDPREVEGIVGAWRSGDPAEQRRALAAMFECLHVEGGHIVACTPRADRAARVTLWVNSAKSDEETEAADLEAEAEEPVSNIERSGGRGV